MNVRTATQNVDSPSLLTQITNTSPSKLVQRAWLHFKQMLQRIQFSPSLFYENKQAQNMHSASLASPDRSWASWWLFNATSSSFTQSLFLKWIRVNKVRRLAWMMPLLVSWVPDDFFLLHIKLSFSRHLLCGTDNSTPELPNCIQLWSARSATSARSRHCLVQVGTAGQLYTCCKNI